MSDTKSETETMHNICPFPYAEEEAVKQLMVKIMLHKAEQGDFDWVEDPDVANFLKKYQHVFQPKSTKPTTEKAEATADPNGTDKSHPEKSGKTWTIDDHLQLFSLCENDPATYRRMVENLGKSPMGNMMLYANTPAKKEWLDNDPDFKTPIQK